MLIVDGGGLTDAASAVEATAGTLEDLDVAGPFATASDALAGSRTSESCLWVSTRLGAALQVYAEGLRSLASAVRTSAQDFATTDADVAAGLAGGPR